MIEPADPDMLPPARARRGAEDGDAGGAPDGAQPGGDDFTVHLDRVFHGPMDLLLQLVRDKELEIHLVSLAEVCDAYCEHVRSLREVDVDEAADYLVIAATLLAIKSRSLLPQEEIDTEGDDFDPGEELVQQLLAYKELRRAAEELAERRALRERHLGAGGRWLGRAAPDEEDDEEPSWDLGEVSIWDLLRVVSRLEEETGFLRPHRLRPTGRPLRAYVEELWHRLQGVSETSLRRIVSESDGETRDAAYYLVALLELAKQQQVDLEQERPFADVAVRPVAGAGMLHVEEIDEAFDHADEADPELDELIGDEPLE